MFWGEGLATFDGGAVGAPDFCGELDDGFPGVFVSVNPCSAASAGGAHVRSVNLYLFATRDLLQRHDIGKILDGYALHRTLHEFKPNRQRGSPHRFLSYLAKRRLSSLPTQTPAVS